MSRAPAVDAVCTAVVGPWNHADPTVEEVRARTNRRLRRFLAQATLPVYAVVDEVYARSPRPDPDDVAVFTISGWEPNIPSPALADPSELATLDRAKLCFESTDPLVWLRLLSTSPLCQVSIANGFRGPNAHFHGTRTAMLEAFQVARCYILDGTCSGVILAAFDTPRDGTSATATDADTSAYAVLLEPSDARTGVFALMEESLTAGDPGDRSIDALVACGLAATAADQPALN